ncbi:MAG: PspA/IM30 family protein [Spirochaetes bacterium]|nr:PspA/IM30 family protein [Spirochaetota bacterium]MBL7005978.1 PspA/IM30 family protein [Spirochaetia bacterium]
MKTANRIKHITKANINSILDKVEKPKKMISLMIQEMEEAVIDLKSSVAAKLEAKAEAEIERKVLQQRIDRWEARAKMAVEKERDDMAKDALLEKRRAERSLEILENDISQYEKLISDGRSSIVELEEKLELVHQRQRLLIQRGVHAVEKKKAFETLRNAESNEAYRRFMDLEAKIERIEAEAEISGFTSPAAAEDSFEKMESDSAIEEALSALKKSMKKETKDKE